MEVSDRKVYPEGFWKRWPLIRGVFNFFDSQVVGVKALMRSAAWPRRKCRRSPPNSINGWKRGWGSEAFQKALVSIAVVMGLGL